VDRLADNLAGQTFSHPVGLDRPIVGSVTSVLDELALELVSNPSTQLVENLIDTMGSFYDCAIKQNQLTELKRVCQEHPIQQLILEDPFVRRAFEKPRGYAGDAPMLDYIYRPGRVRLSGVGEIVHQVTTETSTAKSISWRRDYLAARICKLLETTDRPDILSVAAGHMRELDIVSRKTEMRDFRITALERDGASIKEICESYPSFDIRPVQKSVLHILRHGSHYPRFDYIYSAGLFDYLETKTAKRLIENLCAMLKSGGTLLIGNFAPENIGRGFMEFFMDWSLIYRDESDLIALVEDASPGAAFRTFRDEEQNVSYVEVQKQ